jgi:hypothetical protein
MFFYTNITWTQFVIVRYIMFKTNLAYRRVENVNDICQTFIKNLKVDFTTDSVLNTSHQVLGLIHKRDSF